MFGMDVVGECLSLVFGGKRFRTYLGASTRWLGPPQTWPKHQLPECGNYWILLRGDAPNLTELSLATLERFTMAPLPNCDLKQDPFISALA
jgi:hypothetical protein